MSCRDKLALLEQQVDNLANENETLCALREERDALKSRMLSADDKLDQLSSQLLAKEAELAEAQQQAKVGLAGVPS